MIAARRSWRATSRSPGSSTRSPITNIPVVIVAGFIGFAGNELVALYRIRVGTRRSARRRSSPMATTPGPTA